MRTNKNITLQEYAYKNFNLVAKHTPPLKLTRNICFNCACPAVVAPVFPQQDVTKLSKICLKISFCEKFKRNVHIPC